MKPPSFRDDPEARITALLLGELSPEEADAVRSAIDRDPELAALHDRLRQTIAFVRAVILSKDIETEETAPGTGRDAPKLPESKRQALLARFKVVPLERGKPGPNQPPRRWIPVALRIAALLVVLGYLAVQMVPNSIRTSGKSKSAQSNALVNQLRNIDGAKQQWALENRKSGNATPTWAELQPYLEARGEAVQPIAGEEYVLGRVDESPIAVIEGNRVMSLEGTKEIASRGFSHRYVVNDETTLNLENLDRRSHGSSAGYAFQGRGDALTQTSGPAGFGGGGGFGGESAVTADRRYSDPYRAAGQTAGENIASEQTDAAASAGARRGGRLLRVESEGRNAAAAGRVASRDRLVEIALPPMAVESSDMATVAYGAGVEPPEPSLPASTPAQAVALPASTVEFAVPSVGQTLAQNVDRIGVPAAAAPPAVTVKRQTSSSLSLGDQPTVGPGFGERYFAAAPERPADYADFDMDGDLDVFTSVLVRPPEAAAPPRPQAGKGVQGLEVARGTAIRPREEVIARDSRAPVGETARGLDVQGSTRFAAGTPLAGIAPSGVSGGLGGTAVKSEAAPTPEAPEPMAVEVTDSMALAEVNFVAQDGIALGRTLRRNETPNLSLVEDKDQSFGLELSAADAGTRKGFETVPVEAEPEATQLYAQFSPRAESTAAGVQSGRGEELERVRESRQSNWLRMAAAPAEASQQVALQMSTRLADHERGVSEAETLRESLRPRLRELRESTASQEALLSYGQSRLGSGQVEAVTESEAGVALEKLAEEKQAQLQDLAEADEKPADELARIQPAAPPPVPQPEVSTAENPFSTFSLNVTDVSFKLAQASLEQGQMPDPAVIRSEEFINAFEYHDPVPPAGRRVGVVWEQARYPFAHNRELLRFGVQTAAQGRETARPLNIVLCLDNSGSMERADRVAILREALQVLGGQLKAGDRISVVAFARTARLWVDGLAGEDAGQLGEQLGRLNPEGGTNLEDALKQAYETARRHFIPSGINRVVLLTDGAANLGNIHPESLRQSVIEQRKNGIALDSFGVGWEGYNDDLLETLSRNGDGRYGFLNTPEEAATEFADQLAGALRVAASDVKVQVEFNPRRVKAYRQIGYAKHQLTKEQFRDNTVDAAEIGAAESGNALYVIETDANGVGPLGVVRVRFKVPETGQVEESEWMIPYEGTATELADSSPALRLAATASALSEWLAGSPYAAEVKTQGLLELLRGVPELYSLDPRPRQLEWMIRQAGSIAGQ